MQQTAMSLLKKILSSNLSRYQDEQKKRYKKYVKIPKQAARVVHKSEAELYEDGVERKKSIRESKRRAPVPNQEIIFKEPNAGLSLGPAPAILEATNRYVKAESLEEEITPPKKDNRDVDAAPGHLKPLPAVPKRKKARKSGDDQNNPIYFLQENDLQFPTHDTAERHQAIEMANVSISTYDSDVFYDCTTDSLDSFNDRLEDKAFCTPTDGKVSKDEVGEAEATSKDTSQFTSKDVVAAEAKVAVEDEFYLNYNDTDASTNEINFTNKVTEPETIHDTTTLSPTKINSPQHSITLLEEMNSLWGIFENPHMSPNTQSNRGNLNEEANIIKEIKLKPEDTIVTNRFDQLSISENPQQEISSYELNDDDFISSESEDDGALTQSFNDYVVVEENVMQPTFQVTRQKIKFDDALHQTSRGLEEREFSKEPHVVKFPTNSYEEEAIILDDKGGDGRKEGARYGSSSSEDDVFEMRKNRKVNFDFGNSFCTTYEPIRQPSISDDASLTSTITDYDEDVDDQVYIDAPPGYRDMASSYNMYNQKDSIYKNFGVDLDKKMKRPMEPIYENAQSMDLAELNCKNGYKEADVAEDEEVDQFSEIESMDFSMNKDRRFQDYYDHIGDFKGDKRKPEVERQHSISEIQEDLMEIKKLDDVVTQIDRIQDVLSKIHSQIEYLESRDDENYTSLLKTLLNSMRILGNLNCNFDEDLLKFQQDSMEYISRCINALNQL